LTSTASPRFIQIIVARILNLLSQLRVFEAEYPQYRQVRLITAILLLGIAYIAFFSSHTPALTERSLLCFLAGVSGVLGYVLSGQRYGQLGRGLIVFSASSAVFAALIGDGVIYVEALPALIFPILIVRVLFRVQWALLVLGIQFVVVMCVGSVYFEIPVSEIILPAVYVHLLGGLLVVYGGRWISIGGVERWGAPVRNRTSIETTTDGLAKDHHLLRTVIENLPDHVFVLDREGRYILINRTLKEEFAQWTDQQILGKTPLEIFPGEVGRAFYEHEQMLMEAGKAALNEENSFRRASGEHVHILMSKIPLRDAEGRVNGLVGISRDISGRRANESVLQDAYSEMEQRVEERTRELSEANIRLREQIEVREQAEEQIRYQASLLENISDAIISVDYQFTVRSWNRAAEVMYGWGAQEALGRYAFDLIGANITTEVVDEIMRQMLTQGFWRGEMVDRHRDGTAFHVMASATLLKDAMGIPIGMVLVNRDIHEWKQVEAAEREQRLLAEALRDTSAAINSTLNLPEILEQILVSVEQVIPYSSASIMLLDDEVARVVHARGFGAMGVDIGDVLALRFPIREFSNLQEMLRTSTALVIPDTRGHPAWRKERETGWIRSYVGAPIRIEGKVIGVINLDNAEANVFGETHAQQLQAFADHAGIAIHNANLFEAITRYTNQLEQRVTERTAELVSERAQLQAIMDSMNEGVYGVLFGEKPSRYANLAFQQMTGYAADEWSFDMLREDSAPGVRSGFKQDIDQIYDMLASGGIWEGQGTVRRKDGSVFEAQVTVSRIDSIDNRPVGTVTILRDVSHEKALEQQKSLFVANASHELRTPLTNLVTRLYLIRKQPEEMERHLEVLDEITRRMRNLVEDLLDHSRFERGVIPLEPKEIDLRDLIGQVVNLQMPEAEKKFIRLSVKQPEHRLNARVDPERMIQVITNLVVNAIHYTPEGGQVSVEVSEEAMSAGKRARIKVEDSGIGIPSALLPNLFKPFFRVSEKTKGTGLGLSIARDIIRAHGGDITVQTQPGVGSCFMVDLPVSGGEASG